MNRTTAFIVYAVLIGLTLTGFAVLTVLDRDPSAFSNTAIMLLGLAAVAGGLQHGIETVRKQTNGTLSHLLERNRVLEAENTELRVAYTEATATSAPVTPAPPASPPMPH